MMFVDASAIVAILTRELEADALADALDEARSPITSPIGVFEAALGVCRKRHASVVEAATDVREFLEAARVRTVPITDNDSESALDAFSRYGKGRGHPAQLNLGDCFAYAVAREHHTSLLFKGDDFTKTDIQAGDYAWLMAGRVTARDTEWTTNLT
jgi:ribonuclease VapC